MYPASQVEPMSRIASWNIRANGGVDSRSHAPYHDGYDCLNDVHYSFTIIRTTLAVGG